MPDPEHHEMVLVRTQPSGADEWHCPTCGRRLVMLPAPDFQKIVINRGDDHVIHIGAKGSVPPSPPADADRAWLHSIGIDWDGQASNPGRQPT